MIDAKYQMLTLEFVNNGWVIDTSNRYRGCDGYQSPRFVARTPSQLAELVTQWAQSQQDTPKNSGA